MKLVGGAIEYLLGGARVGGANEARLRRWVALPAADLALPHGRARYVVAEFGTSRAGTRRDRLISIGAVGVARTRIDLADCFATVLRQQRASAQANMLAHGVGADAQPTGADPALAVLDFLDYVGKAPLVVFDIDRARGVVLRATKSILGIALRHPWLDLGALLQRLFPNTGCASVDDWREHFRLAARGRHDPLEEAYAHAQLLQIGLDAGSRAGIVNARGLLDLQSVAPPSATR